MAIGKRQAAYTKAVEVRFRTTQAQVTLLRGKVDKAIAVGGIEGSEQLRIAIEQVEHQLKIAEARIDELRQAGADPSESHRLLMDNAVEDLAQSIRKAVSRFP